MKRLILPLALAVTFAGSMTLFAQAPTPAPAAVVPHRAANPHKEANRIAKQLSLSPDQKTQIEPILADRDQKMAALRSNTTLSQEDRKEQSRAIHKEYNRQLNAILTPSQQAQMKTLRRNHDH